MAVTLFAVTDSAATSSRGGSYHSETTLTVVHLLSTQGVSSSLLSAGDTAGNKTSPCSHSRRETGITRKDRMKVILERGKYYEENSAVECGGMTE